MINHVFDGLNTPLREIKAKVEVYKDSALINTFLYDTNLKNFNVERTGVKGKLFGAGVCQKITVKVIDIRSEIINVEKGCKLKVYLSTTADYPISVFPSFDVIEVSRNEKTGELFITGYDRLYSASESKIEDLELTDYTIPQFVDRAAEELGITAKFVNCGESESWRTRVYTGGANFNATDTLRKAFDDAAGATQTIYYIDNNDVLVFRRLENLEAAADLSITPFEYFELSSSQENVLAAVCAANELGDSLSASLPGVVGYTHFVRNNAFWELREDLEAILEEALSIMGGYKVVPYVCNWRGNFLLEVGDRIDLTDKNGVIIPSYYMDETITYTGGLSAKAQFEFDDTSLESADTPVGLGDALRQTFAKVDKVNKQIDIVASDVAENAQQIAEIKLNTDEISIKVDEVTETVGRLEEGVIDKAVTLVSVEYALGDSTTVAPETGWSIVAPEWQADKYMWQRVVTTYGDNTVKTSEPTCISGAKGESALGIVSIVEQYYLSNSNTEQAGGSWTDEQPLWVTGYFYWIRTKITWSDESITYTEPVLANSINDINEKTDNIQQVVTNHTEQIAQIKVNNEKITSTVSKIQTTVKENQEGVSEQIAQINNTVSQVITPEEVSIIIEEKVVEGATQVSTSSGFTFNDDGLRISKSDSEMSTTVTDNGMTIYRNEEEVLKVNNMGVDAQNLTATTYLIVGKNSRFENYANETRTGCFWIGG